VLTTKLFTELKYNNQTKQEIEQKQKKIILIVILIIIC